ncbi:unnamed protein product [Sphacelaria rigidula]
MCSWVHVFCDHLLPTRLSLRLLLLSNQSPTAFPSKIDDINLIHEVWSTNTPLVYPSRVFPVHARVCSHGLMFGRIWATVLYIDNSNHGATRNPGPCIREIRWM